MDAVKPPYKAPMWARALAAFVVLLGCVAAAGVLAVAVHESRWPVALGDVPGLLIDAGVMALFARVAATGRVPAWANRRWLWR